MTRLRTASVLVLATLLGGCPKSGKGNKPAPSASAAAPASASVATPASEAGAPTGSSRPGTATASASYQGTYSLSPASIYIGTGKDYASVKQAKDDPSKQVGSGAITLTIAPDGRVSGTVDSGPAAPAVIDGNLMGDEVRGNVRRKAPSDDGLTGTLSGKVSAGGVEGKLALAEANAAIVREGQLSLKKQ
jgi:hypothetical protein